MKVREIMTRDVTTAAPGMTLEDAAEMLARRRLRAMPVIDHEGHVLGMLTDRLLISRLLPALERADAGGPAAGGDAAGEVRDIMERTVMCVKEDEPLANVVRLMLDREIERLPVVREGQLVGFLTRGDIIRRLLLRDTAGETEETKGE
ncbi:MAG: CBS domain-containing protein [Gemmatimonadales bacterium]|uniref:CBS domain-containing protein n=1 Tax=Candidatus Palauibacter polyketidifaciens TaxID=3056740 RepID=UPI0013837E47|nr:CBS domain-containing protein [Candidatus Palauibacter polyketidifaciens]MXX70100.1 CBS domain-containing protein [Gemmatimonadales bacterium]MDE2721526.1 CBS domain-containing protein [Candidatus Palauibacter polyketidifaciens]MYE35677.1 CBS domain-containing protein [Gemmatimonadales bacterium]MYG19593.1 CBS domain-containing protein [Gemmatimonadales bacterium]MYH09643.1 CBS domain-containing protein [Gemmatimonadales bacterium]